MLRSNGRLCASTPCAGPLLQTIFYGRLIGSLHWGHEAHLARQRVASQAALQSG